MKIITKEILAALSAVIVVVSVMGGAQAGARVSAEVWASNATSSSRVTRMTSASYLTGYILAIGEMCNGMENWPGHPHDILEDFARFIQEDLPAGDRRNQVFYALYMYFWITGVFSEETSCRLPHPGMLRYRP